MTERRDGTGTIERSDEALSRFEDFTAVPMLVLSLAVIPLLLIPLLVDLSPTQRLVFVTLDAFIWAVFAIEYIARLFLAPRRWWFVRHNIIDLLFVLLPFLRPLRVARSARAVRLLRASRGAVVLGRALKAGREVLTRHKLHYVALIGLLLVAVGAVLALQFERDVPNANIRSFPDALWWAATTVTTVGYGDRFPVTAVGRGVAVVLMLYGIGLFGLLAASLASYFLREERTADKLEDIAARLDRIERALAERESDEPALPAPPDLASGRVRRSAD